MGRTRKGARALGPYEHDGRWKIVLVGEDGARATSWFATEAEADQRLAAARRVASKLGAPTIDAMIELYEQHMQAKGNKASSIKDTIGKLGWFLGDVNLRTNEITPAWAERRYEAFAVGRSADSHRNALAQAKTFFGWMVKRKTLAANPFAGVVGFGKRKKGKAQLRIDEARRWLAAALEMAEAGDDRATAAAMTLMMGLRVSEVLTRDVRDVDDDGTLLWIPEAKSEAGKRTTPIPEVMQPLIARLVRRRRGSARLFPGMGLEIVRRAVWRACDAAKVPRVCTHSMRGLASTIGAERGHLVSAIAAALGQDTLRTTRENYIRPGTLEAVKQRRVLEVLQGGIGGNRSPAKRSRRAG